MKRTALTLLFLSLLCMGSHLLAQTATAAIEGFVVNAANGRMVPRATVVLRSTRHPGTPKSIRADDTGRFQFSSLEPGVYRISAEQQSFFTDPHKRIFHPVIELSDGEVRKDVAVRLLPTAVVTGQIVDEHNDALEHIQVKLLSREYHQGRLSLALAQLAITDDRGEYRIYDVRPGHYFLLAEVDPQLRSKGVQVIAAPGVTGVIQHVATQSEAHEPEAEAAITYEPEFFPGTSDFPEAAPLEVAPGDELHANFVFSGMPSVSIRGVVVNGITGDRVQNASVRAYWTDALGANGGSFSALAAKDGGFEIRGISPGRYTLRTSFNDETGEYNGQETVEAGPLGVDHVLLTGLPDFPIEGHVLVEGENAKALDHVSIEFSPSRIAGAFRVAADGASLAFQGRLRPGEPYTVSAANLPNDDYLKDVRTNGHSIERNQLTGSGPHQQIEIVISPAGGHIEGVVWDQKDQPASVSVLLIPDAAHRTYFDLFRKAHSNREGKFTLRGVPPGTYTLLAFDGMDPDDLLNDPELLKAYADRGESLIVSEGGRYAPLLHVVSGE